MRTLDAIRRRAFLLSIEYDGRPIYQYDLQGNYLQSFINGSVAARICKIYDDGPNKVARGQGKTSGGYIWSYDKKDNFFSTDKEMESYVNNLSYCKKIYQYNKNTGEYIQEFNSLSEASRLVGINISNLSAVLRGKRKFTGGFAWSYTKTENIFTDHETLQYYVQDGHSKKVFQYNKTNGDFIQMFFSVLEASLATSICKTSIASNARGEQKSAGGYCWSYIKADNYFDI